MPYANPEERREYARRYRERNRDKQRSYLSEWRKKNPDYQKEKQANNAEDFFRYVWHNAVNRNIFCNITLQDIMALWKKQEGTCAITGLRMTHVSSANKFSRNASLDRIDSNKGYTRDNIRLVCCAVNKMRSNMTDEEFFFWCDAVSKGRS